MPNPFPTLIPDSEQATNDLAQFDAFAEQLRASNRTMQFDAIANSILPPSQMAQYNENPAEYDVGLFDKVATSMPPLGVLTAPEPLNDPVQATMDYARGVRYPAQQAMDRLNRSMSQPGIPEMTGDPLRNTGPVGTPANLDDPLREWKHSRGMQMAATIPSPLMLQEGTFWQMREGRGKELLKGTGVTDFLKGIGIPEDGAAVKVGAGLLDGLFDLGDMTDVPNRLVFAAAHAALTGNNYFDTIDKLRDDPMGAPRGADILAAMGVGEGRTRDYLGESIDFIADWRNALFGAGGVAKALKAGGMAAAKGVAIREALTIPLGAQAGGHLTEGAIKGIDDVFGTHYAESIGGPATVVGQFVGAGVAGHYGSRGLKRLVPSASVEDVSHGAGRIDAGDVDSAIESLGHSEQVKPSGLADQFGRPIDGSSPPGESGVIFGADGQTKLRDHGGADPTDSVVSFTPSGEVVGGAKPNPSQVGKVEFSTEPPAQPGLRTQDLDSEGFPDAYATRQRGSVYMRVVQADGTVFVTSAQRERPLIHWDSPEMTAERKALVTSAVNQEGVNLVQGMTPDGQSRFLHFVIDNEDVIRTSRGQVALESVLERAQEWAKNPSEVIARLSQIVEGGGSLGPGHAQFLRLQMDSLTDDLVKLQKRIDAAGGARGQDGIALRAFLQQEKLRLEGQRVLVGNLYLSGRRAWGQAGYVEGEMTKELMRRHAAAVEAMQGQTLLVPPGMKAPQSMQEWARAIREGRARLEDMPTIEGGAPSRGEDIAHYMEYDPSNPKGNKGLKSSERALAEKALRDETFAHAFADLILDNNPDALNKMILTGMADLAHVVRTIGNGGMPGVVPRVAHSDAVLAGLADIGRIPSSRLREMLRPAYEAWWDARSTPEMVPTPIAREKALNQAVQTIQSLVAVGKETGPRTSMREGMMARGEARVAFAEENAAVAGLSGGEQVRVRGGRNAIRELVGNINELIGNMDPHDPMTINKIFDGIARSVNENAAAWTKVFDGMESLHGDMGAFSHQLGFGVLDLSGAVRPSDLMDIVTKPVETYSASLKRLRQQVDREVRSYLKDQWDMRVAGDGAGSFLKTMQRWAKNMEMTPDGRYRLTMPDGTELSLSERQSVWFKKLIDNQVVENAAARKLSRAAGRLESREVEFTGKRVEAAQALGREMEAMGVHVSAEQLESLAELASARVRNLGTALDNMDAGVLRNLNPKEYKAIFGNRIIDMVMADRYGGSLDAVYALGEGLFEKIQTMARRPEFEAKFGKIPASVVHLFSPEQLMYADTRHESMDAAIKWLKKAGVVRDAEVNPPKGILDPRRFGLSKAVEDAYAKMMDIVGAENLLSEAEVEMIRNYRSAQVEATSLMKSAVVGKTIMDMDSLGDRVRDLYAKHIRPKYFNEVVAEGDVLGHTTGQASLDVLGVQAGREAGEMRAAARGANLSEMDAYMRAVAAGLDEAANRHRDARRLYQQAESAWKQQQGTKLLSEFYAAAKKRGFSPFADPTNGLKQFSPDVHHAVKTVTEMMSKHANPAVWQLDLLNVALESMAPRPDLGAFVRGVTRGSFDTKTLEGFGQLNRAMFYNNILSAISTFGVNLVSTAWNGVMENSFRMGVNAMMAAGGNLRAHANNLGAIHGLRVGWDMAGMAFQQAFAAGAGAEDVLRFGFSGRTVSHVRNRFEPGSLMHGYASFVEMPSRLLHGTDAALHMMANMMERGRLAGEIAEGAGYRPGSKPFMNKMYAIMADHHAELGLERGGAFERQAWKAADEMVFKGNMGSIGTFLEGAQQKLPMGYWIMPFLRTVYHITERGIEMTPLGAVGTAFDVARGQYGNPLKGEFWNRNFNQDKVLKMAIETERAKLPPGTRMSDAELVKRAGLESQAELRVGGDRTLSGTPASAPELGGRLRRNAMGMMAVYPLMMMAENGNLTGAGPTDPQERQMLQAQGWMPYSIRIGNSFVSYANWGPMAFPLSGAAAFHEAVQYRDPRMQDSKAYYQAIVNMMKLVTEQPYAQGLSQIFDLINGDMDLPQASRVLSGNIVNYSPTGYLSLLNQAGRNIDSYDRKVRYPGNPFDVGAQVTAVGDTWRSKIPFLREGLETQHDVLGRDVRNDRQLIQDGATDPGAVLSNVFARTRKVDDSRVLKTLLRYDVIVPPVPKDISGVPLDDDEKRAYQEIRGRYIQAIDIDRVLDHAPHESPDQTKKRLQDMMRTAGERARKEFLASVGDKFERKTLEQERVRANLATRILEAR